MSTSKLRIPSPAQSEGTIPTPHRRKSRRTLSVNSATSNASACRLTEIISESFSLPSPNRQSILNDATDIDMPACRSWWKKLSRNSKDVNEILDEDGNKDADQIDNIAEEFNLEILSQEKENNSLDLPASSDSESIHSIVMPQRKFFNQKNNQKKKKIEEFINYKETTGKLQKSQMDQDKDIDIRPKKLFNQAPKQKSKSAFSAALVSSVANRTINKTIEKPSAEVKGQVRNLFGNRAGTKRKNMYTEFIVSGSEDEIPEIQPRLFEFRTKTLPRYRESLASQAHSSTSNITDIEIDDWKHLPSSTMVENQFHDMTPLKRPKLKKTSDSDNMNIPLESEQLKKKEVENLVNNSAAKEPTQIRSSKQRNVNELDLKGGQSLNRSKTNKNINNNDFIKEASTSAPNQSQNYDVSEDKTRSKNKNEIVNQPLIETIPEDINQNVLKEQALISVNNIDDDDDDGKNLTLEYDDNDEQIFETVPCVEIVNQEPYMNIADEERTEEQQIFKSIYSNQNRITNENQNKSINLNKQQNINEKNRTQIENQTADHYQEINNSENTNESRKENNIEKRSEKENNTIIEPIRCIEKNNDHDEINKHLQREPNEEQMHQNSIQGLNLHVIDNITTQQKIGQSDQDVKKTISETSVVNEEKNRQNLSEQNVCSPGVNNSFIVRNQKQNDSKYVENKVVGEKNQSENKLEGYENVTANKFVKQHEGAKSNEVDKCNVSTENEITERDEIQNEIEQNQSESDVEQEVSENVQEHRNENYIEYEIEEEKEGQHHSVQELNNIGEETEEEEEEGQQHSEQELNNIGEETEEEEDGQQHSEQELNNIDEETEEEDDGQQISKQELNNTDDESEEEIDDHTGSEVDQNDSDVENEIIEENEQSDIEQEQNEITIEYNNCTDEEAGESDQDHIENDQQEQDEEIVPVQGNKTTTTEYNEIDDEENENGNNDCEKQANSTTQGQNIFNKPTGLKEDNPIAPSPEAVLHDKTHHEESFTARSNKTSIGKSKTMINHLNIRRSLKPDRESAGFSDGTVNSSAEGSGWDSHRTTRKTLRQTFGKDFTPRKSLRALVMERSAKRQTNFNDVLADTSKRHTNFTVADITKLPAANSTRLPQHESYREADTVDEDESADESDHEASRQLRQTKLEMYLQKVKKQNAEMKRKMQEDVMNSLNLPARETFNPFKIPEVPKPIRRTLKPAKKHIKEKTKLSSLIPNEMLPSEFFVDIKYKPPKRFQGKNAPWITKRLYKYLEEKLTPKYDYKARVRAEKLVETLYRFAKETRRRRVSAEPVAIEELKVEMARLNIVTTHYDFYNFFHEFMPREIRIRVNPDVMNNIPAPRNVFSPIIPPQQT